MGALLKDYVSIIFLIRGEEHLIELLTEKMAVFSLLYRNSRKLLFNVIVGSEDTAENANNAGKCLFYRSSNELAVAAVK